MIVTATKHVNARLGKPNTSAANPRFLTPGEKVNVKARVFGETLEGNNEWFLTEENEFFTQLGFHLPAEISDIPFDNVPELFKQLDIQKLWSISKGEGINVGIIDSGVANHPALGNRVKELNPNLSFNADLNNHGTTMACIIAAKDEVNGKIGISPMVENIFSYSIEIDTVTPEDLVIAMDLMLKKKVDVLNLSFCSNKSIFFAPNPEAIKLQNKINELVGKGCIVVCATGNNHRRNIDFYPAKYENVISVSGYDNAGNLDFDSNLWNGISVSMASELNYFDERDSQFEHSNGTSSATAIITGCIACAFNKIKGVSKSQTIINIFSKFPTISLKFNQSIITIPKFNTDIFFHLIKS